MVKILFHCLCWEIYFKIHFFTLIGELRVAILFHEIEHRPAVSKGFGQRLMQAATGN